MTVIVEVERAAKEKERARARGKERHPERQAVSKSLRRAHKTRMVTWW